MEREPCQSEQAQRNRSAVGRHRSGDPPWELGGILLAGGAGPARSSDVGPEISAEQVLDFIEAHRMILAATACDLDCTHQGSEPAGLRPVEARCKTIKKTGAIRIAATGGIHHLDCPDARNLDPFAVRVDDRP